MDRRHPPAADLEPIERASRDELESLQLERLGRSVRHTYEHVAPYRSKCDACGVHPDDLRTLGDLARFPFTTKQDLRDGYPFGLFAVPRYASACVSGRSASHQSEHPREHF